MCGRAGAAITVAISLLLIALTSVHARVPENLGHAFGVLITAKELRFALRGMSEARADCACRVVHIEADSGPFERYHLACLIVTDLDKVGTLRKLSYLRRAQGGRCRSRVWLWQIVWQ